MFKFGVLLLYLALQIYVIVERVEVWPISSNSLYETVPDLNFVTSTQIVALEKTGESLTLPRAGISLREICACAAVKKCESPKIAYASICREEVKRTFYPKELRELVFISKRAVKNTDSQKFTISETESGRLPL